ncbi:OpgC family protein [Oharaeibacter diazotrophicus]|uniref:OpgC protein n=1 Tax=Oharaeibacter diazotrophicus TaxID=1920512 RepID=A0A4R6RJ25_9HYPH|nr:OpgC domain-containing protein [Oharaeibacter diazotrophicus]TDP86394.1 hypothetical protein EDD54_0265 [Oharaeibacter diazotrophicus]BBE71663.1 OpgC protein [Pleomorphomonas sp. SM30]GLS78428.1 hypothetical protein GCM10007904_37650 [Oharaeibacter diazotrophicus]
MRRLAILDGMRGYFLVFMMLNHLTFEGGYRLVRINHGELGYVQDAQGFVFLSGLLVGMVYARTMAKRGFSAVREKIHGRAFELYLYALGCLLAIGLAGVVLPGPQDYWKDWLWQLTDGNPGFAAAAALLLFQPTYLDILPQYIVYMIAAPFLVRLVVEGRAATVLAGSLALWALVQFGLHLPLANALDAAMAAAWPGLMLRAHFNVLAWQIVFVSGLVAGALTASGGIDWNRVFDPARPGPALAALAVVVLFAAYRLGFTWGLVPDVLAERFARLDMRGEFSAVYLLNFAALGYLVTWTIVAGGRRERGVAPAAGRTLRRLFELPFLRLIGRNSLQVYAYHAVAIYLLRAATAHHPVEGEVAKTAVALAAVASLALPALWWERRAERARLAAAGA